MASSAQACSPRSSQVQRETLGSQLRQSQSHLRSDKKAQRWLEQGNLDRDPAYRDRESV